MPRNTREIDLADEWQRLDDEVHTFADEYADAANGSTYQQLAVSKGNRAERHRRGVAWAMDYPETDTDGSGWSTESIELGALTKGDRNLIDHTVDEVDCVEQDAYVALVTTSAPFVEHDPRDPSPTPFKRTVRNVTSLDPAFVDWVDDRAGDIASAGDSGKSFMELATEHATSTTSTEESG